MRSVEDALEQLNQSLNLTPQQQERVTRQHEVVQKELRQRLGPRTEFLSGSYSRNTSIRPLHDIDLFVVMGVAVQSRSGEGVTPDEMLGQVQQALEEAWDNKEPPTLQAHSVHTEFSGSGISFDLVPAYELPDQKGYLIPEFEAGKGRWIVTNPKVHEAASIQANERSGKKLKPLIKLVKLWKNLHARGLLRSFHLEVMSYDAFPTPPGSYLRGLELLFSHLAQRVMRPCPDPAGLGADVDEGMSDTKREAARQLLESAARTMRLVIAEKDTNPAQAHSRMRALFGEGYPERGA
jgi:hypothetical protein